MDEILLKRETQLRKWHQVTTRLASSIHGVGDQKDFDALVYIDELKLLCAIAQSKLDEYKSADRPNRCQQEAGLKRAWDDLGEAVENQSI
jgi:hypothetical protein